MSADWRPPSAASRIVSARRPRPARTRAGRPRNRGCLHQGLQAHPHHRHGRSSPARRKPSRLVRSQATVLAALRHPCGTGMRRSRRSRRPASRRSVALLPSESSRMVKRRAPRSARARPQGKARRCACRRLPCSSEAARRGPCGRRPLDRASRRNLRSLRRAKTGDRSPRGRSHGSPDPGRTASPNTDLVRSGVRPRVRAFQRRDGTPPVRARLHSRDANALLSRRALTAPEPAVAVAAPGSGRNRERRDAAAGHGVAHGRPVRRQVPGPPDRPGRDGHRPRIGGLLPRPSRGSLPSPLEAAGRRIRRRRRPQAPGSSAGRAPKHANPCGFARQWSEQCTTARPPPGRRLLG